MRDADEILRGVEWSGILAFAECDRNDDDFRARVDSDPNAEAAASGLTPPPPPRAERRIAVNASGTIYPTAPAAAAKTAQPSLSDETEIGESLGAPADEREADPSARSCAGEAVRGLFSERGFGLPAASSPGPSARADNDTGKGAKR